MRSISFQSTLSSLLDRRSLTDGLQRSLPVRGVSGRAVDEGAPSERDRRAGPRYRRGGDGATVTPSPAPSPRAPDGPGARWPLTCLALAMAGVWLGLRIATPGEYETRLGRVSVRVEPSATGQLEAYVPLADWGVRLRPFSAPMKFHVEPRTADREVVLRAAAGESGLVTAAEADLRSAVRKTVLRTLRFALAGAALLAVMLALSLAAFRVRNRAVLVGAPLAVIALAAAVCGISVLRADSTVRPRLAGPPDLLRARVGARPAARRGRERAPGGRQLHLEGPGRGARLRLPARRPDGRQRRRRAARAAGLRPAQQRLRAGLAARLRQRQARVLRGRLRQHRQRGRDPTCSRRASPAWAIASSPSRATTTRRASCARSRAAG